MRTAASPFVFMYHGVTPPQPGLRCEELGVVYREDFERHLAIMKKRFTLLHPEECADLIERGLPPPPRAALLTLDDGHQNLLDHALPVARVLQPGNVTPSSTTSFRVAVQPTLPFQLVLSPVTIGMQPPPDCSFDL